MLKTIFDILNFNTVLHKITEQQICFPINIAYKLFKLKKEIDEIEELIFERWEILFGKDYNVEMFNEEQIQVYNLTLQSEVEIDIYDLKKENILSNENAFLSIKDVETINLFFKDI